MLFDFDEAYGFFHTIGLLLPCAGRAESAGEPRKKRRGERCNAGGLPRERDRRAAERAEQRAKRPRSARSEHATEKTEQQAFRADDALRLSPPRILSLEQALDFIDTDELLEVTPKSLRIRKKILDHTMRKRAAIQNK